MKSFVCVFLVKIEEELKYISIPMNGYYYPTREDSKSIIDYMSSIEPYHFLDLVNVIDEDENILMEE